MKTTSVTHEIIIKLILNILAFGIKHYWCLTECGNLQAEIINQRLFMTRLLDIKIL